MIRRSVIFLLLFLFIYSVAFPQAITVLDKADIEFNAHNYYKATSLYKKALKKSTSDQIKRIYFQLGECYRQVNNYGMARQWYNKAIEEGYDNPVIFFHIGNLLAVGG
ncbi:MAG: tetratricopeptide repeat protein, partial [Bacteroidales bacterium]|nr:tetratricopeptide repeat protein [Bacteroidales bacterium]